MIVVADASVLIVLARLGWLDLLRLLYTAVVIPEAVRLEVFHPAYAGSPELRSVTTAIDDGWLAVEDVDTADRVSARFGAGERAAISLGLMRSADLILIDDLDARRAARELGLNTLGTLGMLAVVKQSRLIGDEVDIVNRVRSVGFFVSDAALRAVGLL